MTQDPQSTSGLSAERVAELEHKLADAAAEVAKVQAQLAAATSGGPPETPVPSTPAAGAPAAGVPYGGSDPHVISIDGTQVTPGSGDLASMLQQVMGQVGAARGGTPIVMVNGQNVSAGVPGDLSSYLSPQVVEQVRASLGQLGLDHQLGAMFGAPPPPATPAAPVGPLAEPPRPVPFAYRLATFDISFYELFIMVILVAAPIAVWVFLPEVVPAALLLAVAVIAVFRGRRYVRRIGILKWGKVATTSRPELLDVGTYYGGLTYNNMRKRQASGWDVSTVWYSGPAYTNQIDYTLDGVKGSLKYRGLRYTDGVVLADSRDPSKAMSVVQFPYSLKPEPDGRFSGRLGAWQWLGIFVTLFVEGLVVALAVYAVLEIWLNR